MMHAEDDDDARLLMPPSLQECYRDEPMLVGNMVRRGGVRRGTQESRTDVWVLPFLFLKKIAVVGVAAVGACVVCFQNRQRR
jgi:hypothetical protein